MYENNLEYHCIENFDMKSWRKKFKKQKKDLERKLDYMERKMGKPIPTITDKEAKCYLKRYPRLQKVYGDDIKKAKNHWRRWGFEQNYNKNCDDEDNNILLEDEDNNILLEDEDNNILLEDEDNNILLEDEDNNILLEDEDIIEDNNEGSSITIIVLIGVAILLLLFLAYYLGYIF